MVGVAVAQLAGFIDVEQADFGAATRIAVTDDHDGAAADQHFIVPGALRGNARAIGIDAGHRAQCVFAGFDAEDAAAAQHD